MRVTTIKAGAHGVEAMVAYYAGLAADQANRHGACRARSTTTWPVLWGLTEDPFTRAEVAAAHDAAVEAALCFFARHGSVTGGEQTAWSPHRPPGFPRMWWPR